MLNIIFFLCVFLSRITFYSRFIDKTTPQSWKRKVILTQSHIYCEASGGILINGLKTVREITFILSQKKWSMELNIYLNKYME